MDGNIFSSQWIAMRKGVTLYYLHADHLGGTAVETNSSGTAITTQSYYAYGKKRGGGSPITDHRFTGQKLDGTGLMYYQTRYYDPAIGTFISPDTLVPDATNVFDYNRFLYVRGNPINANDPSGHETSKPEWWPAYLPYTWDLPDEFSYGGVVEWAGENNIPTAFSGQIGVDSSGGFGLHGTLSGEAQGTFNWLSGQWMISWNNSAGMRGGTPVNGGGVHVGGALHYNASSTNVLEDSSVYVGADAEADIGVRLGAQVSLARAVEFGDSNSNKHFDMMNSEGVSLNPILDPRFNAPVDSLVVNLAGGVDITPNVVDGGITTGISDVNRIATFDLYSPFNSLLNLVGIGNNE